MRKVNYGITSQVSTKLKEFKVDLNSQVLEATDQAITEQILPSIHKTLSRQEKGCRTEVDLMSSVTHRSP